MVLSFRDAGSSSKPSFSGEFGSIRSDHTTTRSSAPTDRLARQLGASERLYITRVPYGDVGTLYGVRLCTPILVTRVRYSTTDHAWFATDDRTAEFGIGESWQEAISSYVAKLHAMAHWFQTNDLPLGRMMQTRYQTFQQLFRDL